MTRAERARLSAVVFLVLFTQLLVYPGVDRLVAALGGSPTIDAGTAFLGAQLLAFVLFSVVWGTVSDRFGRRLPFVRLGAFGGAVAYLALAALVRLGVGDFTTALAIRCLEGAFTIGAFSLSVTMLMDLDGGHGRNMGAAGIAIGAGAALGAPVGGQLYTFGPLAPILVSGGLLAVVPVVTWSLPDRTPGVTSSVRDAAENLRRVPGLAVPFAFGFADRFAAGFFGLVGTFYFRDAFGLSPSGIGLLLACFFVPFAFLQYPFGALSDRVGRVLPIAAGSAGFGLAILGVGVAPTVPVAAVGMLLVGTLGALVAPATMALVTDLVGPTERGAAMGGFNVCGSLGFLAGVVGGGWLVTRYGYLPGFAVVGGLEIAIAAITLPVLLRFAAETASPGDNE